MKKVFLTLLLLLLLATSAQATTRYISPATGSPAGDDANSCNASESASTPKQNFHGVNGAVACMSGGDTLIMLSGTYPKGIDRDSTIPNGSAGTPTRFTVQAGATVTIQPTVFGPIEILNGAGRSYITFDGGINCGVNSTAACAFILDGVSSGSPVTVGTTNSNIVVTNFEAKNAAPSGSEPSNGIQASGTNNTFSNCNVHHHGLVPGASGSGGYGVYNGSGSGMTIDGCLFHENGGYGVHVYGSPSTATIKNSIFYQNNQVATLTSGELIVGSGSNHRVFNNVVRDGLRGGIYVFNGCSGCLIYNNTIARNAQWGMQLTSTISGASVRNNIFYNNNTSAAGAINLEDSGSGNTKSENLCFGTGGTTNCNLTSDPTFINAAANDFHLLAGSPAINAGANLGSTYSPDIAGVARPTSGPWEIGAYEFGGPPPTDDFARANGSLGANWLGGYTLGGAGTIVSQQVQGTALNTSTIQTWSTPATPNHAGTVTLAALSDPGGGDVAIILRALAPTTTTFYYIAASLGTPYSTYIYRCVAGTCTVVAQDNSVTWAAGDTLRASAVGSVISVYRNGSSASFFTYTDPSPLSGTYVGFGSYATTSLSSMAADNFIIESLGGVGTATYYVKQSSTNSTNCATATSSTGNNPVNTFGKGLQCMAGGDTLYLMADGAGGTATYTENLYAAGILPPSGSSGAHTTIRTYGTDTIRFTHLSSLNFYNGNFSYVDFIGGCTTGINRTCKLIWDGGSNAANTPIAGSNLAWSTDVGATPSHDLIFDGVRVTGWGWGNSDSGFNHGLRTITVRNSRIDNNGNDSLKTGFPGYGFYVSPENSIFEHNEIDHNGNYGFHQHSSSGHSSTNTIFRYNVVHDNVQTPPNVSQASGQVIIGSYCTGAEVYGNLIYGSAGQYGLRVDYACNGTKVYNNTIYAGTVAGMDMAQAPGGAANTAIVNNIVSNIVRGAATGTTSATNVCTTSSTDCPSGLVEATSATFTNPGAGDFTLKTGSKAINAGTNLGSTYSPDIANVARPSTGAWEIGAYEYTGAVVTGNTYWVRSTGTMSGCTPSATPPAADSGYKSTINAGLACLASGDTLNIKSGTYNERIDASIIPSGTGDSTRTTLRAVDGKGTVLLLPTNGTWVILLYGSLQYITFDGLIADGANTSNGDSNVNWADSASHHIRFTHFESRNNCHANPSGTCGAGFIVGGQNHEFIDVRSHHNGDTKPGVTAPEAAYGFYLGGQNHLIDGCELDNNGGYGIQMYGASSAGHTMRNCLVHDNHKGNGANNTAGIMGAEAGGAKIYNNVLWNNWDGIECKSSLCYNNTIYANRSFGLTCEGTATCTNNIVWGNGTQNGVADIDEPAGASATETTNLCATVSGIAAACSVTANPNFVSTTPGNANFLKLSAGSAAINNGTNLGSTYSPDIAGVARPTSGPWEIGAYEFGAAVPSCPAVPNALVASYGFEGNTTDSSGNGRTASLGAGWSYTGGKYGQGVVSTGASGITVADHDSLDPCNGFTYEGWISLPDTSGNYVFIVKNPDSKAYVFGSITGGYCGSGGVPIGGFSEAPAGALACYPTSIGSGFQHLAVTYDATLPSANVKLYLNGTQVATANGNALLTPTTGTLQFCDSSFGELCPSGTIVDNIQVYNYPRSGPQITADMNAPVGILAAPALKLSGGMKFGASAGALRTR